MLKQQPTPRKIGVAIACSFLFLATFSAWHDQFRRSQKAAGELILERERNSPQLTGTFMHTLAAPDPTTPNSLMVHIEFGVGNLGAPTILDEWRCEIVSEGVTYKGEMLYIGGTTTLFDELHTTVLFQFTEDKALYRLAAVPISTGDRKIGWLRVRLRGISREQLFTLGTVWNVSFQDIKGKRWIFTTSSIIRRKTGDDPGYYPGGTPPGRIKH